MCSLTQKNVLMDFINKEGKVSVTTLMLDNNADVIKVIYVFRGHYPH